MMLPSLPPSPISQSEHSWPFAGANYGPETSACRQMAKGTAWGFQSHQRQLQDPDAQAIQAGMIYEGFLARVGAHYRVHMRPQLLQIGL